MNNFLGPSLVLSSTKQVIAEPHDCLDKEAGMMDLTDIVLGGQREDCVEDKNYLLPRENKFDGINKCDLVCTNRLPWERNSAKVDSWPQFKRRKVEDYLTYSFSASPSFRVQNICTTQGDPRSRSLKSVEYNSDAVFQYQEPPLSHEGDVSPSNVNMSSDVRIYQQIKCHSTHGIESSPILQKEEVCALLVT